ncbi:MAG: hypothetical protein ACJAUV_000528 [Flavobacteriales bacterium]
MKKKTIIYIVLGVLSAIIWFYLFWIPLKTDFLEVGTLKANHFNPFHKAPKPIYFVATDTLPAIEISALDIEPDDIPVEHVIEPVFKPYHLIVGSFSYIDNAEKLKEAVWTQGYEAQILSTTIGFNRVSIASYATYQESYRAWKTMSHSVEYADVWLLKVQKP